MGVLCIFIMYIQVHTHTVYILKIFPRVSMYIYIHIIDIIYKYYKCINFYLFFKYIHACVCIYIYIQIIKINSTRTYIMYIKSFILDAINCD